MTTDTIRRHGRTIRLGNGVTATEGFEGSLPTLAIRQRGKLIKFFRGSSLYFSEPLTQEDKEYLHHLAYSA